jgi:hypothetical protein
MALATVADYTAEARRLLQDTRAPYRFTDADYLAALNNGIMEARRLRPDLFIGVTTFPSYTSGAVAMDVQYRVALLNYICGSVQMADDEVEQDARSAMFKQLFVSQLLALGA